MINHYPTKNRIGISNSLMIIATSALFLFSSGVFAQKKKKDTELNGKIFTIELNEENGKKTKPISDEISFKSDKFFSKAMDEKNDFGASNYGVSVDSSSGEKIINFEAESTNKSEESLNWKGTVNNDEIEGKAVWSKKGKIKKEYSFSGSLKVKK